MRYDLTDKKDRAKFVKRANGLLKNHKTTVMLTDESHRTVNQNSYLHVLCRILANETGVSEDYSKQVYFKRLANENIFVKVTNDRIAKKYIRILRSTSDLTVQEMSKAISSFLKWSSDNGYYLPKATLHDDGSLTFDSQKDSEAFHKALIETGREEIVD